MKPKDHKYLKAVERNIAHAPTRLSKYTGLHLRTARMKLGIREGDETWDDAVLALIKQP